MSASRREFFSVDLRGLRSRLKARAVMNGLTESELLRSVLANALSAEQDASCGSWAGDDDPLITARVKLSIRLLRPTSSRLDHNARAAGLSRGVYLTRLIDGAPPVIASSDREAMFNALNASSEELAVLSRDINHLTELLRQGSVQAAGACVARHEALDADLRRHLGLAARVLAELSSTCLPGKRLGVDRRSARR
jgi:hypothetical protein